MNTKYIFSLLLIALDVGALALCKKLPENQNKRKSREGSKDGKELIR